MRIPRVRWLASGLGALLTVLGACAVTGVDATVGYGYDAGYYEPGGYDYGGWGSGYRVGPGRGGDRRVEQHSARPYRSAPATRPTPSIPHGSRGSHH
jgi:hypothetical protein